jgi:MFS transporter, DHA1 family, multidrug resistance protein
MIVTTFFFGLLFGNLNALAMAPFGKIAGVASGTIGALPCCWVSWLAR